jgi:hypothetical protein
LKKRAALKTIVVPAFQDHAWRENRKEIGAYLNALHSKQDDGQTPFDLIWKALRARTTNGEALEAFRSVTLPERAVVSG